jgi:DNA-binding response OmpR family regulator
MPGGGETILIVEDDPTMLRGLKDNFEREGYRVVTACHGEVGLSSALSLRPDLIVLDIMLPGVNGYEICRQVRKAGMEMPIVMLTAKSQEADVVLGLNLGADDYVTKPFGIKELRARVAALLRRRRQAREQSYRFAHFELNTTSRKLLRSGREVPLTPKEYGLLELLVRQSGRALTRDRIMNEVWGHDVFVTPRSVDRCVTTLRTKIEPDADAPRYIVTLREVGYRFEPNGNGES